DPGPRRDERQAHGRSGPTRGSIPARRGQRMGRIGDGRDGGCLGRLVQAHGEGKLRRRAIGVLEADHRAPGVERGDPRREERAETLVEIGPAERRGDASGKGLERRGSIDGSWRGVLQSSRTQVVNPMPPIMEPGEFFMPYPLEVEVGGATVFVLPVERYERI